MTKAALGGRAMRWAITRVKPEQASKVQLRMPTRQDRGRQYGWQKVSTASIRSAGVVGMARRKGDAGNVGDPLGWSFWLHSRGDAHPVGVGEGHSTAEAV